MKVRNGILSLIIVSLLFTMPHKVYAGQVYTARLYGPMMEEGFQGNDPRDILQTVDNLSPGDVLVLYIDSPGGDASFAWRFKTSVSIVFPND